MKKFWTSRTAILALALLMTLGSITGGTIAWFTDSVTSGNNIIKSGTLDVTMEWADGKENPANANWSDASAGAIFNYDLWEPGYTEVRHIKIANVGTLALKYQLSIEATDEVSALANVIDVYYLDPAAAISNRTELAGVTKLGTLSQALAGVSETASGNLVPGANHTVTLALKMQESAGNEYQGVAIGSNFAVKLMATQLSREGDSFDEYYDENATYPGEVNDATGLQAALSANQSVKLSGNVDLAGVEWKSISSYSGVLDGNGYAIRNLKGENGLFETLDGATVKNLKIENAEINGTSYYTGILAGNTAKNASAPATVVENVTVSGTVNGGAYYTGGLIGADSANHTVIRNCVNNATIISEGQQVGGILGYAKRDTLIDRCTNTGDVTGEYFVGGIIGLVAMEDDNPSLCVTVMNCENKGTVSATSTGAYSKYVGGIAGVVGREGGKHPVNDCTAYLYGNKVKAGQEIYGGKINVATGMDEKIEVIVGDMVADGVVKTAERAYAVSGVDGLMNVNNIILTVNSGEGIPLKIKLLSDVDLAGKTWKPIEKMWVEFDGNGHTISNLTCNAWKAGLFGYLGGGSIKNLTLENVNVTGAQAGAFAGSIEGTIDNCVLKGENNVITWAQKHQNNDPAASIEKWSGVGAITGIVATSTINATIAQGAIVTIDKTGMTTQAAHVSDLTGYLNASNGTVTNNGTVTVVK